MHFLRTGTYNVSFQRMSLRNNKNLFLGNFKKNKMNVKGKLLRKNDQTGSGRVRQYTLANNKKVTQITTFCPDIIGPGPTNLYVIEDDFLTLVDTGIPTHLVKKIFYYWRKQKIPKNEKKLSGDHSETELISALKLAGYSINDIDLILITHGHIDHYLLANKIIEQSKAKVAAHLFDTDMICNSWSFLNRIHKRRSMYIAMGIPEPNSTDDSFFNEVEIESQNMSLHVDYPIKTDGPLHIDNIKSGLINVVHTPGHSPGSISFLIGGPRPDIEKILISGDVLLYPITPHPDDLVAFLRTLNKLNSINNISLTLPAHGSNIISLKKRIAFLIKHHKKRLEMAYNACIEPKCIWDIASMPQYFDVYINPKMFNPMAGNEVYVHINLLEMAKGVHRSNIVDNIHYYKNSNEKFDDVYKRVLKIVDNERETALQIC